MNYSEREIAIKEIMNEYGKEADLKFIEAINPGKILIVDGVTIIAENKDFHEVAKDQIELFECDNEISGKYELSEFEESICNRLKDILKQAE